MRAAAPLTSGTSYPAYLLRERPLHRDDQRRAGRLRKADADERFARAAVGFRAIDDDAQGADEARRQGQT